MAKQKNGADWTPEDERGLGDHMQQTIRRDSPTTPEPDAEPKRDTGDEK